MGERIYIYTHTHIGFWWGNVREKGHLGELELDGRIK